MAKHAVSVRRVAFEKHLLIDAANVIHAWPELRALLKRDRDAARSQLIQCAGAVHDAESVRGSPWSLTGADLKSWSSIRRGRRR
jgi:hypothetical protein